VIPQFDSASITTVGVILGFVFLFVGVRWMIEAFLEREFNSLWWLWLISGTANGGSHT
jgi:hypothetical protein